MNEKEFEDIFESISSPCSGSFRIVNEGLEKVVKSNIEWGEDSEIDTDGVMDAGLGNDLQGREHDSDMPAATSKKQVGN